MPHFWITCSTANRSFVSPSFTSTKLILVLYVMRVRKTVRPNSGFSAFLHTNEVTVSCAQLYVVLSTTTIEQQTLTKPSACCNFVFQVIIGCNRLPVYGPLNLMRTGNVAFSQQIHLNMKCATRWRN